MTQRPSSSARTKRVPPHDGYDAEFLQAWKAYPNKTGKGAADAAWRKRKPPVDAVLSALAWQRNQPKWLENSGEFIPHMATWLNQRRWEDEPFEPAPLQELQHNDAAWAAFDRMKGRV